MKDIFPLSWSKYFEEAGNQASFAGSIFRNFFHRGFEWNEFIRQCYMIGYKSVTLVGITGFILGFVLTLQAEPTMKAFGAQSFIPSMVAISVIREVGPVIISLICAGKISSSIGAELGSMNVTEQLDAMEVSGINHMQYLVVTRTLACMIMIPLLTIMADAISLVGGYIALNITNNESAILYFNKSFSSITFTDVVPSFIKTVFFGFAIGFVGCYKGYTSNHGTESVGLAANSAVVNASLWILIMDGIAVQLTSIFAYS